MRNKLIIGLALGLLSTGAAHAQLEAVTTANVGLATNLVDITANGGNVYTVAELIGGNVTHYRQTASFSFNNVYTVAGAPAPTPGNRASVLDGDDALNTGLANIGVGSGLTSAFTAATFGLNYTFDAPVQNRPGIDVILFETEIATNGNPFWVSLSNGAARLFVDTPAYSVSGTNLAFQNHSMTRTGSPAFGAASLAELESNPFSGSVLSPLAPYRGVGIDLSDLGIIANGSVTSLYFQAVAGPAGGIDPTLIRGLPTIVPETSTFVMMGAALPLVGGLLLRRRRS